MANKEAELQLKIDLLKKEMEARQRKDAEVKRNESIGETLKAKKLLRDSKREVADSKHAKALDALDKGSERLKQAAAGYDSFTSGMLAIVSQCRLICDANPLGSLIKGVASAGVSAVEWGIKKTTGKEVDLGQFSPGALFDLASTHIGAEKAIPATLPSLNHYVEFTDDNKLNIDSIGKNMRRSDGKDFTPSEERQFAETMKLGMDLWLERNGYEVDPDTDNCYRSKNGHVGLTKDKFEELRDDPNDGLDKFLSGKYDMKIERATGPRPAAPTA